MPPGVLRGGNGCLGDQVSLRHSESGGVDSEDALQRTRRERPLERDKWNNHTQSRYFQMEAAAEEERGQETTENRKKEPILSKSLYYIDFKHCKMLVFLQQRAGGVFKERVGRDFSLTS